MSKEEFEILDDLSDHANLPKVLINTPKLFSNNINNQHNGKLTKSTCLPLEHQANIKYRKNGDLSLSLKVGTNLINYRNKILFPNKKDNTLLKTHIDNYDKKQLLNSQRVEKNKKSENKMKNSPNPRKKLRSTVEAPNFFINKKFVHSSIINTQLSEIEENNQNKKIILKRENNDKIYNIKSKDKSSDNKYTNMKKVIKYKKILNTLEKTKNEKINNSNNNNINNKNKILKEKSRIINKSRDFNIRKNDKILKMVVEEIKLINLDARPIKKVIHRNNNDLKKSNHINIIKEFNSNSSHVLFNKVIERNSVNKNKKFITKKLNLRIKEIGESNRNTIETNKEYNFKTQIYSDNEINNNGFITNTYNNDSIDRYNNEIKNGKNKKDSLVKSSFFKKSKINNNIDNKEYEINHNKNNILLNSYDNKEKMNKNNIKNKKVKKSKFYDNKNRSSNHIIDSFHITNKMNNNKLFNSKKNIIKINKNDNNKEIINKEKKK